MKMILWVEDQRSVVVNILGEPSNHGQVLSDWLLENHHIHWVKNVDDALTAMASADLGYDFFLLDVALPAFGDIGDYSEITIDNKRIIKEFVSIDGWKPSNQGSETDDEFDDVIDYYNKSKSSNMNAGMHLYLYLIHSKNMSPDKMRVYSSNTDKVESFKSLLNEKGIPAVKEDYIFTKATAGDVNVKKWILETIENKNRILRHAMIEGCDEALKRPLRTIYPLSGNGPVPTESLQSHLRTIRDVVKTLGPYFEGDDSKRSFYFSTLILLITSEVQKQHFSRRDHLQKEINQIQKEEAFEYKQLMGVLDRIRNLHAHADDDYSFQFVAFTFLVYLKLTCSFGKESMEFERCLLALFGKSNDKDKSDLDLECCYRQLEAAIKELCGKITIPYYFDPEKKNSGFHNKSYFYQYLLGGKEFRSNSYQYGMKECYRLFLFNFINYNRYGCAPPKASVRQDDGVWIWGEIKSSTPKGKFKPAGVWYDDYIRAFYSEAFPKS